jgi:hypothetical protein
MVGINLALVLYEGIYTQYYFRTHGTGRSLVLRQVILDWYVCQHWYLHQFKTSRCDLKACPVKGRTSLGFYFLCLSAWDVIVIFWPFFLED